MFRSDKDFIFLSLVGYLSSFKDLLIVSDRVKAITLFRTNFVFSKCDDIFYITFGTAIFSFTIETESLVIRIFMI